MGSLGTANGSRSTMTQDSCSPGTSTPCQKLGVANVRHLPRQVQQRLLGIIEFRRQRAILGVIDSQALANVIEAPADGERRGRQDHRVELFKQPLAQDLADIDGRGRQEYAFTPPLVPVDEIALVRFEQE